MPISQFAKNNSEPEDETESINSESCEGLIPTLKRLKSDDGTPLTIMETYAFKDLMKFPFEQVNNRC